MSELHKETVRRFFGRVLSEGDLDAIEELFSPDYLDHDPLDEQDTEGQEGVRADVSMYRSAFPDFQATVEDQLAEGDRVATRVTVRGTHGGEFQGIPPTQNEAEVTGIVIHRFADRRIAEAWWNWDALGLLQQIGAIPAEQPA